MEQKHPKGDGKKGHEKGERGAEERHQRRTGRRGEERHLALASRSLSAFARESVIEQSTPGQTAASCEAHVLWDTGARLQGKGRRFPASLFSPCVLLRHLVPLSLSLSVLFDTNSGAKRANALRYGSVVEQYG